MHEWNSFLKLISIYEKSCDSSTFCHVDHDYSNCAKFFYKSIVDHYYLGGIRNSLRSMRPYCGFE